MLQEVGNPLRITHIGLATRDRLDVLGVHHQQFKVSLQEVKNWLPIHARRFEGDMGTASSGEPVLQEQQFLRGGAKGADLLVPLPIGRQDNETSNDQLLVDVESTTAFIDDLHSSPPNSVACLDQPTGCVAIQNLFYVLATGTGSRTATDGGAWQHPDRTQIQARSTKLTSISWRWLRPAASLPFFMDGGEPAAHG